MTFRKWIKGLNGLWSSVDLTCLRQAEAKRRKEAEKLKMPSVDPVTGSNRK